MNYEKILMHWKEFDIPSTTKREINLNLDHDLITTITGPRRAGKTFLCFQKMKELLDKGIPRDNLLYINFEDDKLLNSDSNDLEGIFEIFIEEVDKNKKIFLFFDEIQVVKNWDSWIRKIYDTKKELKLILTGSSSKMLSREISTKLRGRIYNIEVLPLSFKEYLMWKDDTLNMKSIFSSGKDLAKAKKYFKEYLFDGGYPSVLLNPKIKEDILQNYYDSMIFKDVVERYNIIDVKKLQILSKLIFESTSREISYTNLSNKLKSLGFSTGKSTVIEHLSYLEEAYLFFQVLKYEYSLQKQLGSIKKVYCIDNGLLNSITFKFSENKGKLLENLVFLELRRRKNEIYYNREKFECDFVIKEKNKITMAIQVTNELSEENKDREINGLVEAMEKFNLNEGLILTYDDEGEMKINKKTIKIKPVYKWILEK